jgi:hypothetical protein
LKRRGRRSPSRRVYYALGAVVIAAVVGAVVIFGRAGTTPTGTQTASKPIILYVNQGNGVVNGSNFGALLQTASSHGFNTIFFQVYRSGSLLFGDGSLRSFVAQAHAADLKLFFALYFTNSSQTIPSSVYGDGEDGINLDMSTLPAQAQAGLFGTLSSTYQGTTAITTTDPALALKPDLLIVETYGSGEQQYIHPGMIGSVGVFATTSKQDYQQQFSYALGNSDGVMVFDYAGLVKAGY